MSDNDYDTLRQKNIAERNAIFAEFFKEVNKLKAEEKNLQEAQKEKENIENEPPRKKRRISHNKDNDNDFKNSKRLPLRKRYNTRSTAKYSTSDELNDSDNYENSSNVPRRNRAKLKVLFPWAKPFQRSIDLMKMRVCDIDEKEEENDDDDDDYDYDNNLSDESFSNKKYSKVSKSPYDPNSIPSVDKITQEMLDNVAKRSTLKKYCKIYGTSCHQCRQKTLDTKTVCRSGECIGIRGQFCGPCLQGRYGESAVEALQDPNWACPPCRDLCNCSICRTRNGLRPTGILAPVAQEGGYSSVMDYLQSVEDDT
ncbi:cell division cycle-associated protein 7-like [Vespa mandarinia]|uniref:cell division cycle-associated protein 7-like n=1 Tax=Vespa mandarinia TaxID=7446 RepID=UPI00160956B7|nr:cell division cycle-associated protein 7-like [Vespa mandarinia]